MKYKKYPAYKDSGVEWLGEIPSEWNITRLGNISSISASGIDKKINEDEKEVKIINFTDIHKAKNFILDSNKEYMIVTTSLDKKNKHQVKKGDLIFTPSSETINDIGISALVNEELLETSFSYHVLRCNFTIDINHEYKKYLTNNTYCLAQFSSKARGTTRQTLSRDDFRTLYISLPPIREQQQIANYLDEKTSKIDNLIEKQTKQIELLKEKRQAVISHAVTKGINPNVPMKDSGVEWLGEIPEHWEVKKLKFVLQLLNKKEKIINQIVVALENIESWSGKYIESDSSYQGDDVAFCIGDILFGKLRPYLAKVFLCSFDGIAFGDLLAYRPIKDYASKYAFYSLISEDFIKIVDSSTYGTKMPRASSEFLSEMRLTVPPLKEQQQIANYLDEKTSKIDILIEKSNKSIELLKEKRTALISVAVTGKIDVREFA